MSVTDTPSPVQLVLHNVDDETPEKLDSSQHVEDDIVGEWPEGITYGLGPHVNNYVVPLVDRDFNPIATCTDDCFFLLGPWIYKALKLPVPKYGTQLHREIKTAIAAQCGKHTRLQWKVDLHGNPLDSVLTVSVQGVDLTVITSRQKLGVKFTPRQLAHVLVCARQCATGDANTGAADNDPESGVESVDHAVDRGITTALTTRDLDQLKSHKVKWHPSKRIFLYGKAHAKKKCVK
eukprot:3547755-Karenia_brevis.AAC.1